MRLNDIIADAIENVADEVRSGNISCSDEEISQTLDELSKFNSERPLSKEEACIYMNLPRTTFDTYVRNGWIPRGRKQMGFKELSWTKSDLEVSISKIKEVLKTEKDKMFDRLDD